MSAEIQGTLIFNEDSGCILLEFEDGDRYPVVWPAGTFWRPDPPAVMVQGQLIEPGLLVKGAGGALSHQRVEEIAGADVADAAEACAGPTGEIALFNLGSDVIVVTD